MVYPSDQIIAPYLLDDSNKYQPVRANPFVVGEEVPVGVFPDLVVEVAEVFGVE